MPASNKIWVRHGSGGGTTTDVTAQELRYKRKDNSTVDLNDPVPIPSSGVNYSAAKFTQIAWLTTPTSSISNLRWYLEATPTNVDPAEAWDGVTMWVGITVGYLQSPDAPTGLVNGCTANADVYGTSANPIIVNSGTVLSNPSTGVGTQPYVVTQLAINANCISGVKSARPWYYRWVEV